MTSLQVMTLNCQGLGDPEKRRDVLNYLRKKKHNIYCLQDTHFTDKLEPYIKAQWGYTCIFNSYTSNSRGVAIMLNNNFDLKINRTKSDNLGNYLAVDMTIDNTKKKYIYIYGPNEDNPTFFENILKIIDEFENEQYIICGDFNLVLNQNLDTSNYIHVNHPNSKNILLQNLEVFDLVDPFRELYPTLRRYTWRKKTPTKQARLDYYLISKNLMAKVEQVTIDNTYRSDHAAVILKLNLNNIKRGKGLWKFNTSLLHDKDYVKIVKQVINDVKIQYAIPIYKVDQINRIPTDTLQFVINDQLFLETVLMEIRGKTIAYSSAKKREKQERENKLCEDIKILEENAILNFKKNRRTKDKTVRNKKGKIKRPFH